MIMKVYIRYMDLHCVKVNMRDGNHIMNSGKWSGEAYLINTFNSKIIYLFSAISILFIIYVVFFCSLSKRIDIEGEVISDPKSINLYAYSEGTISGIFYATGDVVKKDSKLISIDSSSISKEGRDVNLQSSNTLEQISILNNIILKNDFLSKNRVLTLDKQRAQYEKLLSNLNVIESNINKGVYDFKKNKMLFEEFLKKGLITKEQAAAQAYNYYQQYSLYQTVLLQKNDLNSKITNIESKKQDEINNAIIFKNNKESEIVNLKNKLNDIEIKNGKFIVSPINGIIQSINITKGEQVKNGDIIAQVGPLDKKLRIITWVPNYVVPYIHNGNAVIIRYDAFPYEQYGQFFGKIEFISNVSATKEEISKYNLTPQNYSNSLTFYKVIISDITPSFYFKQKKFDIKDNMIANITFFYDKRRIYNWIFSPIYKLKKITEGE